MRRNRASSVPVRPVEAAPLGEADALDEVADSGFAHPLGELHVPQRVVALADDPHPEPLPLPDALHHHAAVGVAGQTVSSTAVGSTTASRPPP